MLFLSFFNEAIDPSKTLSSSASVLVFALSVFGVLELYQQKSNKRRKLKWQLLRFYMKQTAAAKKQKADGTTIFLLILMLIACVAILWVLWALGGIFALILGIVFGVGILSLVLRD